MRVSAIFFSAKCERMMRANVLGASGLKYLVEREPHHVRQFPHEFQGVAVALELEHAPQEAEAAYSKPKIGQGFEAHRATLPFLAKVCNIRVFRASAGAVQTFFTNWGILFGLLVSNYKMYEKIHGDISRDTRKNDGMEARRRNDEKGDGAVEQMGDRQQRHYRYQERTWCMDGSASGIPRRCGEAIRESPALPDFSGRIG